ncbi:hypothetical protein [Acinetobacter junii]|uniref:hypothetical protein n=1 Tax=Acinetobacter junii TaxID=40215 RepID=UPI000693C051|nr:hypothetical protein [Acinetobacter junii]
MGEFIEIKHGPKGQSNKLQALVYRMLCPVIPKAYQEITIGKSTVYLSFEGFPWQIINSRDPLSSHYYGEKWGWNPLKVKGSGRFGGGWAFKFGITSNENFRELIIDVGIGSIRLEIMNSRRGFRA